MRLKLLRGRRTKLATFMSQRQILRLPSRAFTTYTNRMVDGTDELQNALAINPKTLKPSSFGTKILTSHVHDALRDYLGLANASTTAIFPFNNTEKFNFFV